MGTFWKGKWAREGKKSREGACFPPPPPPSPARAASRASQLAGRSRVTACADPGASQQSNAKRKPQNAEIENEGNEGGRNSIGALRAAWPGAFGSSTFSSPGGSRNGPGMERNQYKTICTSSIDCGFIVKEKGKWVPFGPGREGKCVFLAPLPPPSPRSLARVTACQALARHSLRGSETNFPPKVEWARKRWPGWKQRLPLARSSISDRGRGATRRREKRIRVRQYCA